jgi:estrogen-related receptor beta like 1
LKASILKKLGISFEHGPAKLKQGWGDAVIYILQSIVDAIFTSKEYVFKKPIQKTDE